MKIVKNIFALALIMWSTTTFAQDPHSDSGLKKVIVQEVLQVQSYTYLNVLENGEKKWLAVPRMEAELGEIYYYQGGMVMPDFKSTELDRTFDSVVFLSSITNEDVVDSDTGKLNPDKILNGSPTDQKPTLNKLDLDINSIKGGVLISELFENSKKYEGKKIKVIGEVTKFSSGILAKNWVHFQDGTAHDGAYDLMITTQENVYVGEQVIFEGKISLDRDFGAGYTYKIIMEEAVLAK